MLLALATALGGDEGGVVPVEVYGPIVTGMIVFIALRTPPSLRRWRLTGGHRMVPSGTGVTSDSAG
jgi:hypothetical protein